MLPIDIIEKVRTIRSFLFVFAEFVRKSQNEHRATISSVLPTLLAILIDLEEPDVSFPLNIVLFYFDLQPPYKWHRLENVANDVAAEMRKRFAAILPSSADEPKFNPTYLIASFLDPNYGYLLDKDAQKAARKHLIAMVIRSCSSVPIKFELLDETTVSECDRR
jgi:hypothetical protein